MIEELKLNTTQEKKLIRSIESIITYLKENPTREIDFYHSSLNALVTQLKIINGAVPELIRSTSPLKSLNPSEQRKDFDLTKIKYLSPISKEENSVVVNKKDADSFIKELKISQEGIRNVEKEDLQKINLKEKTNPIPAIANRIFSNISEKINKKIPELSEDLKKANINMLSSTYISIALFSSIALFILSFIITIIMVIITPSLFIWAWIPFTIPLISALLFYIYPSNQKSSVENRISQELPFATIYMAAIASSNVEPTRIFKIISSSKEFPFVGAEFKKVVTQIEFYGYDLVSSLKNAARRNSNEDLAELLLGIATNISSGGNLKDYLAKKTENFLSDYKLDRQKYNSMAELFMDIYISVLITGPLILMILFMIMNLGNFQLGGLSMNVLFILTVGIVTIANIIFIIILDIKQPKT